MPYWGTLLAASLDRPLTYRSGSEVGAALGAARLARAAVTAEPPEEICTSPPVQAVVQPDAALMRLLAERRPMFRRLYRDLKQAFVEYST